MLTDSFPDVERAVAETPRETLRETTHGLAQLSAQPSLTSYVRSVWDRREFAFAMSVGEMRARHSNMILGGLWHVLTPLLLIGVYYLVFGVILGVDRGVENFVGFLAVGIFVYQFSQRSIVGGSSSISNNIGLVRSLQFPRAILPLSTVFREFLMLRAAAVVTVAVVLVTGEGISLFWLLVLPLVAIQFLFNLGAAMLVARIADRVPDLTNLLPFVFRLLFYMSGVLFLVDRFVSDPALKALFVLNPLYCFVSIPREYMLSTLDQQDVGMMWLSVSVWALVAFVVGLFVFRSGESEYGRA